MLSTVPVGVGVFMSSMLYIVVGLVIVLLIAVVVLKNKAQKPPMQPPAPTGKKPVTSAPVLQPIVDQTAPSQSATESATSGHTKFDSITVAERFMDQQRYDKAIEVLKRGLIEKPHDDQLTLKLLNVYAVTDKRDDFDDLHNQIRAHNNVDTISEANQLNDFLIAERNQQAAPTAPVADFESLDFDIPSNNQDNISSSTTEANTADDFNLTLDDLEPNTIEPNNFEPNSFAAVDTLATTADSVNDFSDFSLEDTERHTESLSADDENTIPSIQSPATEKAYTVENIDDDFTLDFDQPTDKLLDDSVASIRTDEVDLSDDDFALDFDTLTTDSIVDSQAVTEQQPSVSEDIADFTLSLDDDTVSTSSPTLQDEQQEQDNEHENLLDSDLSDDLDIDLNSDLNSDLHNDLDTNVEDASLQIDNLEVDEGFVSSEQLVTDISDAPSYVGATTPTVDDYTLIDDDASMDIDHLGSTLTAVTPVEDTSADLDIQSDVTIPTADMAVQFAADFDFVKTLDNNQVTLDLAQQYLQLGEYDSAKRLLNEVISQGNSEQRSEAQELLTRSA